MDIAEKIKLRVSGFARSRNIRPTGLVISNDILYKLRTHTSYWPAEMVAKGPSANHYQGLEVAIITGNLTDFIRVY